MYWDSENWTEKVTKNSITMGFVKGKKNLVFLRDLVLIGEVFSGKKNITRSKEKDEAIAPKIKGVVRLNQETTLEFVKSWPISGPKINARTRANVSKLMRTARFFIFTVISVTKACVIDCDELAIPFKIFPKISNKNNFSYMEKAIKVKLRVDRKAQVIRACFRPNKSLSSPIKNPPIMTPNEPKPKAIGVKYWPPCCKCWSVTRP